MGFLRPIYCPGGAPRQQHPDVLHGKAPTALGTLQSTKLPDAILETRSVLLRENVARSNEYNMKLQSA